MKEYTITYTAEITDIVQTDELPEVFTDPLYLADDIRTTVELDDVHVKNVKVFEREV